MPDHVKSQANRVSQPRKQKVGIVGRRIRKRERTGVPKRAARLGW